MPCGYIDWKDEYKPKVRDWKEYEQKRYEERKEEKEEPKYEKQPEPHLYWSR